MTYKAVVFDLFNTLVDEASQDEYQRNLSQMASVLAAPAVDFARLWRETYLERNNGTFNTAENCLGPTARDRLIAPHSLDIRSRRPGRLRASRAVASRAERV